MTTTKDCRVCDNCGQPIAWGLGQWWHATFLGCVILNPDAEVRPMTDKQPIDARAHLGDGDGATWSTLADRLEARPLVELEVSSTQSAMVVLLPEKDRDELVAFLRGLPMEFVDPARAAAVSEQELQDRVVALFEFVNRERAAGVVHRFCPTCNAERPTYLAGDGGSVEAGTECCTGCGRVITDGQ